VSPAQAAEAAAEAAAAAQRKRTTTTAAVVVVFSLFMFALGGYIMRSRGDDSSVTEPQNPALVAFENPTYEAGNNPGQQRQPQPAYGDTFESDDEEV